MDYQGMTGKIYQVEEERMNGGGEGTIHGIVGMNGYVAKIFKPDKRSADREEKLRCMVKKGATVKNLEHITWPLDVIYNAEGFAGYVMQKIENVQSLTAVYNGDKYNLRFRLLAAYNLCAAVETVHNMGQVCGDLNPQNICINLNVNDKANAFKVTLVDADSYHFSTEEKTYRCEVGLADYLAPEIQKKVSGGVTLRNAPLPTFTKETDLFALAVHVFCLLMNGCHPFACAKRMNGTVENTMSQMTSSSERESVVAPQPIENIKDGIVKQWFIEDEERFINNNNVTLLDTRTAKEFARGHIEGFKNIPVDELRERLHELGKSKPVYVICQSGLRSYISCRILEGNGFETYNFAGGYRYYEAVKKDKALIEKSLPCGMDN